MMKRHDLSIEDIAWEVVRGHLRDLNAMLDGQSVNPTEMGKLYGKLSWKVLPFAIPPGDPKA